MYLSIQILNYENWEAFVLFRTKTNSSTKKKNVSNTTQHINFKSCVIYKQFLIFSGLAPHNMNRPNDFYYLY